MSRVLLDNVVRHYGAVHALEGLSLAIEPGEVLGLLGHNGAGKTTTIKLVLGVIRPTRGSVQIFGHDPAGPAGTRLRHQVGFLPENVSFYPQLNGREVLRYFGRLKGSGAAECDRALERVGLAEAADRRVKTYSKGMRQRLGLAQALLGEPQLLLLDEPTVGLDPVAAQDFYGMIDELRNNGCSIVLCSHILPGLEQHVDRVAILGSGRLLASGSMEALRAQAGLPLTISVRGDSGAIPVDSLGTVEDVRVRYMNGNRVDLEVTPAAKMNILRPLFAHPAVDDVAITASSLEQLYNHFTCRNSEERRP